MLSMVNTICRKLMLFKNLVWVTRYFQNKRGLFYYYSFVSVVHIVPYKIESSDYVITSKTCLGDTYFKERKKKKRWGIYLEKPIQEAVCKTSDVDVSGHCMVLKYI